MLKDKSVIVTGAAKGIGRYIAHSFAREGARVTVADVDEARMQQTVAEIGELGADALGVLTDVRDEDSVRALMAAAANASAASTSSSTTPPSSPTSPGAAIPGGPRSRTWT